MRERQHEIEAAGADWVIVGNGAENFARAFREDFALENTILVDPDLIAYRAAGLRRGRVELLSPRLVTNALRALSSGARQTGVEGDPWQLGGVFVIRPGGELTYRHASREAGDHPPIDGILEALEADAPPLSESSPEPSPLAALAGRALSLIVDPTIVASFDRTGFLIHSLAFDPRDLDVDLSRRRCLVTGANSGIGFETSRALADLGAEVVLLCRSRERGERAVESIRSDTGNPRVTLELLDVSDLGSVRTAARRLAGAPVDVLVHNAGVLPDERQETADGLELAFATHVAGPFLLTRLLQPRLEKADAARVVFVSSGGMYTRALEVDDPNWSEREYDGVRAYAETKRAQVVLAEMWAERLRNTGVSVNAMHPGWADTPAVATSLPGFHRVMERVLRSPAQAADTVVWLAAAPTANETGRFYFDRRPRRTHLLPFTRETDTQRTTLWTLCEELTT